MTGLAHAHDADPPGSGHLYVDIVDPDVDGNELVSLIRLYERAIEIRQHRSPAQLIANCHDGTTRIVVLAMNTGSDAVVHAIGALRSTLQDAVAIIVSASGADVGDHLRALEAGADAFLPAPATLLDYLTCIHVHRDRLQLRREVAAGRMERERLQSALEQAAGLTDDREGENVGLVSRTLAADGSRASGRDHLTGLPDGSATRFACETALARAQRRGEDCALLFLELSGLPAVNEEFGRGVGDGLVLAAARRFSQVLADQHKGTADLLRPRGDVLLAILVGRSAAAASRRLLATCREALDEPWQIAGSTLHCAARLSGMPIRSLMDIPEDLESALRPPTSIPEPQEREIDPAAELDGALAGDELDLYYQPRTALRTGEICALESLLRWHRPGAGLLGPEQLLAAAIAAARTEELAQAVIRQLAIHRALLQRITPMPARLGCHFGIAELRRGEIRDALLAFADSGTWPLEIELSTADWLTVTENDVACYRDAGIKFAVNCSAGHDAWPDCGVAPDCVLLAPAPDETRQRELATFVATAREMKVATVLTRVETAQDLAFARGVAIDAVQGWLLQPAMTIEETLALLRGGT